MATTTENPVSRLLEAIAAARLIEAAEVFASDAVLDATVPQWRYATSGGEKVAAELSRWYADPGQFEEVRRTPLPGGELVEFTLTWEEHGIPHAAHQVHVLTVTDGRISSDRAWCGGRWPAALLAEMDAAGHAG